MKCQYQRSPSEKVSAASPKYTATNMSISETRNTFANPQETHCKNATKVKDVGQG